MPTKGTPKRLVSQGPTGDTVRQNIARLRKASGITSERLVQAMAECGYNMPRTAISEIENGGRRVTVDDLMALAIALNVNPNALLLPNYSGDADVSYDVTAMPNGTTGTDIWEWADGWKALPFHRENAPEIHPDATGWGKGRQMHAKRAAEQGGGFLDRIRPSGETPGSRTFIARIGETVNDLGPGEWVALWQHASVGNRLATRAAAYPEGGWSDISMYFERIKIELEGIAGSDLASPFIRDVSKKLGICNGND
jgi:transcriptional regulator with XRE-family HTH domain